LITSRYSIFDSVVKDRKVGFSESDDGEVGGSLEEDELGESGGVTGVKEVRGGSESISRSRSCPFR